MSQIQSTQTFKSQLATQFNRLNRDLLVADTPATWHPAIKAMSGFLDQITDLPGNFGYFLSTVAQVGLEHQTVFRLSS